MESEAPHPKRLGEVKCGHCRVSSFMTAVVSRRLKDEDNEGTDWYILRCPSCYNITLIEQRFTEFLEVYDGNDWDIETSWYKPNIIYPVKKRSFTHLPTPVARAYEVALNTYLVEPIAFAVLIGRTLEFACKERGAKGKDLASMLSDLAKKGELPQVIVNMAHGLRFFRNISAHASEIEISPEDAQVLRDLCDTILEYMYEAPSMLKQLEARITELKKRETESYQSKDPPLQENNA